MNTVFNYLYRDGSNYKQWGSVVFAGTITDALTERFTRSLDSGEFFIADQLRIREVFPETWPIYADDHCWHEWAGFEGSDSSPDDFSSRTIEEFVRDAEHARESGWNDFDPQQRVRTR